MVKMTMLVELEYDQDLMYDPKDADGLNWLLHDILGGELSLVSEELGDAVGTIKVIEIKQVDIETPLE